MEADFIGQNFSNDEIERLLAAPLTPHSLLLRRTLIIPSTLYIIILNTAVGLLDLQIHLPEIEGEIETNHLRKLRINIACEECHVF
jgi:hypothetical protein